MKFRKNFFTEQLKKIMFERKLTQEELAVKMGVNRQQISRWLTTDRNPSLKSIKKLSNILNVPVNYFIDENNNQTEASNTLKKLDSINLTLIINLIKKENKILEKKIKNIENKLKILENKK